MQKVRQSTTMLKGTGPGGALARFDDLGTLLIILSAVIKIIRNTKPSLSLKWPGNGQIGSRQR